MLMFNGEKTSPEFNSINVTRPQSQRITQAFAAVLYVPQMTVHKLVLLKNKEIYQLPGLGESNNAETHRELSKLVVILIMNVKLGIKIMQR